LAYMSMTTVGLVLWNRLVREHFSVVIDVESFQTESPPFHEVPRESGQQEDCWGRDCYHRQN
jgi:hypothetical protein